MHFYDLRLSISLYGHCRGDGDMTRYKARQILATGSLLLDGPGPGAEGVAGLGRLASQPIRRAQLFCTCEDTGRQATGETRTFCMFLHGPCQIYVETGRTGLTGHQ